MPLLDIVKGACRKLTLPQPQSVANNPDPQVQQLLGIAIEECEEAAERHDWSVLRRSGSWTIGALSQGTAFLPWPAEFGRMPFDAIERPFTIANRSMPLTGPVTSDMWAALTTGMAPACGVYWRPYGAGIQVVGAAPGEQITFDFISRNGAIGQEGSEKLALAVDSDRPFLPERLVRLGVIWRWRQTKGFEYAEDLATYERELERVTSVDTGIGAIATSMSEFDRPPLSFPSFNVTAS